MVIRKAAGCKVPSGRLEEFVSRVKRIILDSNASST